MGTSGFDDKIKFVPGTVTQDEKENFVLTKYGAIHHLRVSKVTSKEKKEKKKRENMIQSYGVNSGKWRIQDK